MKEYDEKTHLVISRKVATTHKTIMYIAEMLLWLSLPLLTVIVLLWTVLQVLLMFKELF